MKRDVALPAIGIDTGQVITYNALLGPATVELVDLRC